MTYTDPRAIKHIQAALDNLMPEPIVDHRYVADVIAVTLRGGGFGIEAYPDIIKKRQAALSEDGHRNHRLSNALNVIGSAVRDYGAATALRTYPVEDEVIMYLAAAGYRIILDTTARAALSLRKTGDDA
jgi:hypothetical protein